LSLYYPLDNDEMQGPTGAGDNDRRDIARYGGLLQAMLIWKDLSTNFSRAFEICEYSA
jgi:hypothetical protein